jgi:hypothetical protein
MINLSAAVGIPHCGKEAEVMQSAADYTSKCSEFEYRYVQEFCLRHVVQTASGSHPASYPVRTRDSSREGKATGV